MELLYPPCINKKLRKNKIFAKNIKMWDTWRKTFICCAIATNNLQISFSLHTLLTMPITNNKFIKNELIVKMEFVKYSIKLLFLLHSFTHSADWSLLPLSKVKIERVSERREKLWCNCVYNNIRWKLRCKEWCSFAITLTHMCTFKVVLLITEIYHPFGFLYI